MLSCIYNHRKELKHGVLILKDRLIKDFEVKVSSAQIHTIILTREKKHDESVQEHVLTMREIGSRTNIETEVVIQYIIDGI